MHCYLLLVIHNTNELPIYTEIVDFALGIKNGPRSGFSSDLRMYLTDEDL